MKFLVSSDDIINFGIQTCVLAKLDLFYLLLHRRSYHQVLAWLVEFSSVLQRRYKLTAFYLRTKYWIPIDFNLQKRVILCAAFTKMPWLG